MDMGMIEKILAAGRARGLSQLEIERRAKLAKNRISKIKDAEGKMRWEEVTRMARAVGANLDWLASDQPDNLPRPTDDELRAILDMVADLGIAEARRRLLQVPGPRGYSEAGSAVILDRPLSPQPANGADEPGTP